MSVGTAPEGRGVGSEEQAGSTLGRRAFICGTVAGAAAAGTAAAGGTVAAQEDPYQGWFEDVDNYEGTVDYRGRDEVTLTVGAGDSGLLFGPPAILVDPGTTVVWEWSGVGGTHNVVHEPDDDGDPVFESETYESEGETFEHTFDEVEQGIYRYFCSPHRAVGMKGAVAIGEVDDELVEPSGGGGGGGGGGGSQPLTATDMALAAFGILVGVALIFAVVRPDTLEPDRT